jgi:hypothetical protein
MKDFLQILQDALPVLKNHPRFILWVLLSLIAVGTIYRAKDLRKRICKPLSLSLYQKTAGTSRWLYVYQDSTETSDWLYCTSEISGNGSAGDDLIWTLVSWPSLIPKDSFRVHGAVGMVNALQESQVKLEARWNILHDPDSLGVGLVPAIGIRSKLRRSLATVLRFLGSI